MSENLQHQGSALCPRDSAIATTPIKSLEVESVPLCFLLIGDQENGGRTLVLGALLELLHEKLTISHPLKRLRDADRLEDRDRTRRELGVDGIGTRRVLTEIPEEVELHTHIPI